MKHDSIVITANAEFIIAPLSSISFIIPNVVILVARLAINPIDEVSFILINLPNTLSGFASNFEITNIRGNAPVITAAALRQIMAPSSNVGLLKEHNITQCMSRKGNCMDNGVMENFFGRLKVEMFYREKFESVNAFIDELKKYIHYYNNERISLKLKGMSPVQYRTHSLTI